MTKRSDWQPVLRCCMCQTEEDVKLRSPDMDIDAIPTCPVCWFELMTDHPGFEGSKESHEGSEGWVSGEPGATPAGADSREVGPRDDPAERRGSGVSPGGAGPAQYDGSGADGGENAG